MFSPSTLGPAGFFSFNSIGSTFCFLWFFVFKEQKTSTAATAKIITKGEITVAILFSFVRLAEIKESNFNMKTCTSEKN